MTDFIESIAYAFATGFALALYAVECDVAARLAAWDRAAIDATCTERPA